MLSREALRRFYRAHHDPQSHCVKDNGSEDVEIARCLRAQGVVPGRSLDEHNRELFHPLPFADHFLGRFPDWLHWIAENPPRMVRGSRSSCHAHPYHSIELRLLQRKKCFIPLCPTGWTVSHGFSVSLNQRKIIDALRPVVRCIASWDRCPSIDAIEREFAQVDREEFCQSAIATAHGRCFRRRRFSDVESARAATRISILAQC